MLAACGVFLELTIVVQVAKKRDESYLSQCAFMHVMNFVVHRWLYNVFKAIG